MNQYLCPECQTIVSENAAMCPTCGCPIEYIKSVASQQAPSNPASAPFVEQPATPNAFNQQSPQQPNGYQQPGNGYYGQQPSPGYGGPTIPPNDHGQGPTAADGKYGAGSMDALWHTDIGQYLYESVRIMKNTMFHKFFCFSGRATRREYWSFVFFWQVIPATFWILGPFLLLFYLAAFFPALGVTIRRLHDNNHSFWWIFVPIVCFFFLIEKNGTEPNEHGYPAINEPLY